MKPHRHAELIKAWADGAEIEVKNLYGDWIKDETPNWTWNEYRIKPEPKPDVVRYLNQLKPLYEGRKHWEESDYEITKTRIQLVFDGETGELKSAEVLK